jgi:DNA-binding LacI/PurR family transcriptional regulator
VIGIAGRFAPEIQELLVPYILAQALENALGNDPRTALRFFDTFCDRSHSLSIAEGAERLLDEGVDGLCVIHPHATDVAPIMAASRRTGAPVVFLTGLALLEPVRQIGVDHRYDGFQAANCLLERGHREILFVKLGSLSWVTQRLDGARAAVAAAGLPPSALQVYPENAKGSQVAMLHEFRDQLRSWTRREIRKGALPPAVIAANDEVALEIMEVAQAEGLRMGADLALIGFDDIPAARRKDLTTLRLPVYDLAEETARLIESLIENGPAKGQPVTSLFASQLVLRGTV